MKKSLNKFTEDFIVSQRGQWDYPGLPTAVPTPTGKITTKGVKDDLIGIDNLGNSQYMTPGNEYQFEGDMVYEIPQAKKGGSKKPSKKLSRSLMAKNILFTKNQLFKKAKSVKNKIFDPNSPYLKEGGAFEIELDDAEIDEYRRGGYIVEELDAYTDGGSPYYSYGNKKYIKKKDGTWFVESNGKYVPITENVKARTAELNKNAKYNSNYNKSKAFKDKLKKSAGNYYIPESERQAYNNYNDGPVSMVYPEKYFIGPTGGVGGLAFRGLGNMGTKFGASVLGQGIKAGFNTALPLGEAVTSATAGSLTPLNLLSSYFGADAVVNQFPGAISDAGKGEYLDATEKALYGTLGLSGLGLGKQVFKPAYNSIKGLGYKGVPKELPGSPNSFELFDLNNVRKPSGSIGNQGATPESANKILKSLGIKVKGKIPNEVSLKEMVEHLKNNPKDASRYKKFLENEPISVSELPGGEYQINDGHHRATLSYYSGNENIPAIIKNKGEYIFNQGQIPKKQFGGLNRFLEGGEPTSPEEWGQQIKDIEGQIGNPSGWTLSDYSTLQNKLNEYKSWRENTPEGQAVIDTHNEEREYDIPLPEHLQDYTNAMMKARLAYANEFGNPAAKRMINIPDNPYQFDNGDTGTHYMASMDNYAVPQIQDENGVLQLGDYGPESNEAIRFDSDEDANYFAEHYTDVSPGFLNQKQYGGLNKFVGGGEPCEQGFERDPVTGECVEKTPLENCEDGRCEETDQIQKILDEGSYIPKKNINLMWDVVGEMDKRDPFGNAGKIWTGKGAQSLSKRLGMDNPSNCMWAAGMGYQCLPETKGKLPLMPFESNDKFINAVNKGTIPFSRVAKTHDPNFASQETGMLQQGDIINFKGAGNSHAMTFSNYREDGVPIFLDSNGNATDFGFNAGLWKDFLPNKEKVAYVSRFNPEKFYEKDIKTLEEKARTNPTMIEKQYGGPFNKFVEEGMILDLSPKEIEGYKNGGYIVKELDTYSGGGSVVGTEGLTDNFSQRLSQFILDARAQGIDLNVGSGYRSYEKQKKLWEQALKKYGSPEKARKWVAPPGSSNHNKGLAVDLSSSGLFLGKDKNVKATEWAHANAKKYGLNFRMGWEPWHIEPLEKGNSKDDGKTADDHDHSSEFGNDETTKKEKLDLAIKNKELEFENKKLLLAEQEKIKNDDDYSNWTPRKKIEAADPTKALLENYSKIINPSLQNINNIYTSNLQGQMKRGGFIMELDDNEIKKYIDGGYVVKEIN